MSANDSYVVVGNRKSLPQVYVGAESETGSCHLRKRSGDGSDGCSTPPAVENIGVSTPCTKTRYGSPGCLPSMYQPRTPTSPHSVFEGSDMSAASPRKKKEEAINIDSGYGDYYSSKQKAAKSSELWDSLLMTPVENLKKKLKKRPSFVDDSRKWEFHTEQILGWIVFLLILVSFLMAGFITYAAFRGPSVHNFNNGKYESIKYAKEKELEMEKSEQIEEFPTLDRNFLLEEDITIEEIFERKRGLEDDYFGEEREFIVEEDYIYEDVPRAFNGAQEESEFLNRDSQAVLKEAEELVEEEVRLIKTLTEKLELINSASNKIPTSSEPEEPIKEFIEAVDNLHKEKVVVEASSSQQQPNNVVLKNKKSKAKNPLVPKKNMSKAKFKDAKKENFDTELTLESQSNVNTKETTEDLEERIKRSMLRSGRENSRIKASRFRKINVAEEAIEERDP